MTKAKNNIINSFGEALALLVSVGSALSAAAQTDLVVFYAPIIASNSSQKGHTVSSTTNNQILTMDVDGSNLRQLTTGTENCFHPAWRPGKTHILFHRGDSGGTLYVMDKDGGGMFAVAPDLGDGADWSPDGNMICYVGHSPSPPGPLGLFIVSVDPFAKGNKKVGTPVCVSQGDFYGPAWSHDGTRIAFSDQLEPGGGPHVRVLDLATGTKTTLDLNHSLLPSWSPTDQSLAFVSGANTTGYWQLFIMNADLSGVRQVTSYNNSVLWPTWSPNGTQMVFRIGTGQNGDASLYKLTLATGELTLLRDKGDHVDWNP